jgi:hypothetical protein
LNVKTTETIAAVMPQPLTKEGCVGLRWRSASDHRFAAHMQTVLLSTAELAAVTLSLPWFFIETGRGKWRAAALLSASSGTPCPWLGSDGVLRIQQIPFLLRNSPFTLLPQGERYCLGFWNDKQCIGEAGQPMFQEGRPSPSLRTVSKAFAGFLSGVETFDGIGAALNRAKILRPLPEARPSTTRIFQVDEDALRSASDAELGLLTRSGALAAAHAQILSRHHLAALEKPHASALANDNLLKVEPDCDFLGAVADDLQTCIEIAPGVLTP